MLVMNPAIYRSTKKGQTSGVAGSGTASTIAVPESFLASQANMIQAAVWKKRNITQLSFAVRVIGQFRVHQTLEQWAAFMVQIPKGLE